MKKRLIALLLVLCIAMSLCSISAIATDEAASLPQLTAPINLRWDDEVPGQHVWEFPENGDFQGQFRLSIFKEGESEKITWVNIYGPLRADNIVEIPFFASEVDESGTYYFTVQSIGDGVNYADSDIVTSPTWTYTRPEQQFDSLPVGSWTDDQKMKLAVPSDTTNILDITIEIGYSQSAEDAPLPQVGTHYDMYSETGMEIPEEVLNNCGTGYYYFRSRVMSNDITVIRNSELSDWSEPLYISVTDEIIPSLQDILKDATNSSTDTNVISAVQEVINDENRDDLKAAMLTNTETVRLIKSLETETDIEVKTEVDKGVFDSTDGNSPEVTIVGAALNADEKTETMTLRVAKPANEESIILPAQYNNSVAVKFDMDLGNATKNKDGNLPVPVMITMPIPTNINPDFLVILHYSSDPKTPPEILTSAKGLYIDKDKRTVSFVLDHFSSFAMVQESVAQIGEAPYVSLQEAINAANAGDTITLLEDITIDSTNGIPTYSGAIVINKAITLNGNGHSIAAGDTFGNTNIINVVDSGEVTIKDLTVTGGGSSRHGINIFSSTGSTSKSVVTLENVVTTGGLTGVTIGGSDVTIKGENTNIAPGSWNVAVNLDSNSGANDATLIVENGTIGNIYIENTTGTADVTAKITGGNIDAVSIKEAARASAEISGGTFNVQPEEMKIAEGYVAVDNGDGTYTVQKYTPTPVVPTYAVTTPDVDNGTIAVSPKYAVGGSMVTITVTPDEGYKLDTLTVTDAKGNELALTPLGDGKYSFKMPYSKVTVNATFVETEPDKPDPVVDPVKDCPKDETCPAAKFEDVKLDEWYHDGIHYCIVEGLMNGTSAITFEPDSATDRAMLVTVLYRLEGQPEAGDCPFTDVRAGEWYTDAITWAAENKIVEGYGDGTFGPEDSITREQFATILYRYAKYKGYDVSAKADITTFVDGSDTEAWAEDAMAWAVAEKLINGIENNQLDPQGDAIRAQMATILYRFCENVAK